MQRKQNLPLQKKLKQMAIDCMIDGMGLVHREAVLVKKRLMQIERPI